MSAERLQAWLVTVYILLIPIGWSPFPYNIQWSDLLFLVLLMVLLGTRSLKPSPMHWLDLLVILYLVGSLCSLRQSSDLAQSGLEYLKRLYLALVYGVFSILARRRDIVGTIVMGFSLAAGLLAGVGLLAMAGYYLWGLTWPSLGSVMVLPYVGRVFRIQTTLASWELFGDFLTFALPLLIGLMMEARLPSTKRLATLAVVVVIAAAMGTISRSIAGLFAAGLFSLWNVWAQGRLRVLRATLAIVCLIAFVGVNVASIVSIRDIRYVVDTDPTVPAPADLLSFQASGAGAHRASLVVSYNPISYGLLKGIAWKAFWREPLTGIGLDQFPQETDRAYREGKIHEAWRLMDPHSTWFGGLAETGLVGTVPLVALWVGFVGFGLGALKSPGHRRPLWVTWATVAGICGLLVNSLNVDVMNFRFLWVGFALLRAQGRAST